MARFPLMRHPLLVAAIVSLFALAAAIIGFLYTQPVLVVAAIAVKDAPALDGDLSDAAWSRARPVTIATGHGGDFGGTGATEVEVKALHDRDMAYFSFVWHDPTRSLWHQPLVKAGDGWHLVAASSDPDDAPGLHDDRFAVMFARPALPLLGAAIHLGRDTLDNGGHSMSGRGLHYTTSGKILDVMVWSAAADLAGSDVHDIHIGPPAEPTGREIAGLDRYIGGIEADRNDLPTDLDMVPLASVNRGPVIPRLLPERLPAADLGDIPSRSVSDQINTSSEVAVPLSAARSYSTAVDLQFPPGTVIPGLAIDDHSAKRPSDTECRGQWAADRWALECRRPLKAHDSDDITISSGAMMWLAAFDHALSRHTYHIRPLKLELQ